MWGKGWGAVSIARVSISEPLLQEEELVGKNRAPEVWLYPPELTGVVPVGGDLPHTHTSPHTPQLQQGTPSALAPPGTQAPLSAQLPQAPRGVAAHLPAGSLCLAGASLPPIAPARCPVPGDGSASAAAPTLPSRHQYRNARAKAQGSRLRPPPPALVASSPSGVCCPPVSPRGWGSEPIAHSDSSLARNSDAVGPAGPQGRQRGRLTCPRRRGFRALSVPGAQPPPRPPPTPLSPSAPPRSAPPEEEAAAIPAARGATREQQRQVANSRGSAAAGAAGAGAARREEPRWPSGREGREGAEPGEPAWRSRSPLPHVGPARGAYLSRRGAHKPGASGEAPRRRTLHPRPPCPPGPSLVGSGPAPASSRVPASDDLGFPWLRRLGSLPCALD
ncbi:glutamate receptor ionotropic, NMDA 2D-like [Elephas maximus indicus]|uniref:glutamate receptor ionotropic, NMDA 2D-like n=1 Tax=Elephas maximus indicus TaxID=99487 RepID=UPI002116A029|nr:glutamate receptor ionotropic, NMDA 2D-like [Elephas maximus indicus]